MAKDIMKKFTSPGLKNLAGTPSFLTRGLMVLMLIGLMAVTGRSQTNFASAQVLSGLWGAVENDNTGVTADPGAPSNAGFPPNAPLWYSWTAPQDGEVTLDTVGSYDDFTFSPLDTVLAVYTGPSLGTLSQTAANDDLFPINASNPQINESGSADYAGQGQPIYVYTQPYNGPSHLRFNAKGGTKYYFVADTKNGATGTISLNWARCSSS
jgi:hypothetical protein